LRKDGSPFSRVLVANRGEIAVRIIRACHELGMEAVAVYSDVDADAGHVRAADLAVRLGPATPSESYILEDEILAAAIDTAGLVFVGPAAETIAMLGDKLAARRLAREAGVPVVAGTLEPASTDRADTVDSLIAEAEAIGFPLLVKAAAGGGGRGMRRVSSGRELPAALAAGSAEALSAFGDGSVYLEREILPARHIEVQLMGDRQGTIVAVGERDCSLQRRHQKLVEESPAPGLSDGERAELHAMAIRLGRAAGLHNAATAEFLFDEGRRFWFLEVNTRLQVEHGVTELAADVDLVREQLLVASGRPLSAGLLAGAAAAARPNRHAIEVRLSAEDPGRDFAPAPGRIGRWRMPAGPGVRIDTAIEAGERVPSDYDPLIAKLLVVDADRAAAIARLRRVLDEVEISGIQTTLPFHRFVAAHPGFGAGELSTAWVAQEWDPAVSAIRQTALAVAMEVAAATSIVAGPSGPASSAANGPADPTDGWRRAAREESLDRWPQ
jgi:acetyl/propionyl-CoA carboxylase alpha subunit